MSMIISWLLQILVAFVNMLTLVIPQVSTLPFGMDDALIWITSLFNAFLVVFWPMQIVWTMFLWYLGYRAGLYVLKFFLGHRLPVNI